MLCPSDDVFATKIAAGALASVRTQMAPLNDNVDPVETFVDERNNDDAAADDDDAAAAAVVAVVTAHVPN